MTAFDSGVNGNRIPADSPKWGGVIMIWHLRVVLSLLHHLTLLNDWNVVVKFLYLRLLLLMQT